MSSSYLVKTGGLESIIQDLTSWHLASEAIDVRFVQTNTAGESWYRVRLSRRQVKLLTNPRSQADDVMMKKYGAKTAWA